MTIGALTRLRRGGAVGVAVLVVTSYSLIAQGVAGATATATSSRIQGTDRFQTAANIAAAAFPTGASTVILASGENANFPDALAGNYLAGQRRGPILLTTNSGSAVPSSTSAELKSLGATSVVVLGSSSSVPDAQITSLKNAGYAVTRIGGATRYDTAQSVAENPGSTAVGTVDGIRTAIIADGQNFPDAVAAGSLSYADKLPVVLTTPATLAPQANETLKALGIGAVIIVGGTASVSSSVESAIHSLGISTLYRAAGTDRANTSQLLADWAITNLGFSNAGFVLASGDQALGGADALAGGPLAGLADEPILVTNTVTAPGSVVGFASEHILTLNGFTILGSTSSVSSGSATSVLDGATGTSPTAGGIGAGTARPELTAAAIVSTVVAPSTPVGTTVSYTFDESVGLPNAALFKVYDVNGVATTGSQITSTVGNVVKVLFSTIDTTAKAAALTTATVAEAAVQDLTGLTNPEGDEGIGSTTSNGTTTLAAGITSAPDLTSVSAPRAGAAANSTALTFFFDQKAYPLDANDGKYFLYQVDGAPLAGLGPTAAQTAASSTSPGGAGTTALTVVFPTSSTLTSSQIERVTIGAQTVYGDATVTTLPNAVQAVEVSNSGETVLPDLLSVQLIPATDSSSLDQVLYTFDQNVASPDPTKFYVYYSDATKPPLQALAVPAPQVNGAKVLVDFPHASLAGAVGGYALASAVTGSQDDERGATGSLSVAGQVSDRTPAPDLVSVALVGTTDVLGNVSYKVTYTFDQAVDTANVQAADFHLWLPDGTKLDVSGAATFDSTDTQVTYSYTQFTHDSGGAAATAKEVGSSGYATVEFGAVKDSTNTYNNPEGSAYPTGGAPAS